ncbi:hypothetical protein M011DRAFT_469376 [Sporormia fimetaria CBS 119925]|uniref:Extracellular membrane protein CFEM domain-containing protein n=1 Tax=Sporormia fimetaria CBS 119925 TaxID=1340428 RepID=A0A6A6V8T6_9PLEO|nr:hypothetical protein M011DRAFT_469376 [Sporormia fimetaria CBS 119925]
MHARSILLALFGAAASLVAAQTPPGCLLGAVNTFDDPADIEAVCKDKNAPNVIAEFCGEAELSDALKAFEASCESEGVDVVTSVSPSATASGFSTRTSGSVSPTGSSGADGESGSPAGNDATPTGSVEEATGAAGRIEVGVAMVFGVLVAAVM